MSDRRPPDGTGRQSTRALARDSDYRLEAGGNDPAPGGAELDALFVSQGVPDDLPLVLAAARAREPPQHGDDAPVPTALLRRP